ncbi:MAG: hypothetical protein E5W87_31410, partial [Mesorhizobium sp.]
LRFRCSRTKSTLRSGSRKPPFSTRPDLNLNTLVGARNRARKNGRKNHPCLRQSVPQGDARQCRRRHRGGSGGSR